MSDNSKNTPPVNEKDAEDRKRELEANKRNIAVKVQADRTFFWLFRTMLCLIISIVLLFLQDLFGVNYSNNIVVLSLSGFFVLVSISQVANTIEQSSFIANELQNSENEIDRRSLSFYFRDNVSAIQFTDLVFSTLLIFAISICFDIATKQWWQAFFAIAWFLVLLISAAVSRSKPENGRKNSNFGAKVILLSLIIFWPSIFNGLAFSLNTELPISQDEWQTLYRSTILRIGFTFISAFAVVFVLTTAADYVQSSLYDQLLRLLPARRDLQNLPVGIRNMISLKEFNFLCEVQSAIMASLTLGAVMYSLYAVSPTRWIFFMFNIMSVGPILISSLILMRNIPNVAQKYVRRLGLQYAAILLILINIAITTGYILGYGIVQLYKYLFQPFGEYPYPDRFYFLREVRIIDLPITGQIEALITSIIVLFALSWVVIVMQNKAWIEAGYITSISAGIATAPYFGFDLIEVVSRMFPALSDVPTAIIALSLPALKGLFGKDIEKIATEAPYQEICQNCEEKILIISPNFCPSCGADLRTVRQSQKYDHTEIVDDV